MQRELCRLIIMWNMSMRHTVEYKGEGYARMMGVLSVVSDVATLEGVLGTEDDARD